MKLRCRGTEGSGGWEATKVLVCYEPSGESE